MCVVAHAALAHPHGRGSAFGEQHHRLMGDPGSRPEQQRTYRGGRNVDDAPFVRGSDGIPVPMDGRAFQIDERQPITCPDQFADPDRSCTRLIAHAIGARVSRPQPYPLARPIPFTNAVRSFSGSLTASTPS